MATLEGVMRTEFGEGLTLEAAAEEASIEVVAPDRTLVLTREDGSRAGGVGSAVGSRRSCRSIGQGAGDARRSPTPAGELRVLSRQVDHAGHRYVAGVVAPLAPLHAQHAEMVRAMCLGVVIALIAGCRRRLADRAADAEAVDTDGRARRGR